MLKVFLPIQKMECSYKTGMHFSIQSMIWSQPRRYLSSNSAPNEPERKLYFLNRFIWSKLNQGTRTTKKGFEWTFLNWRPQHKETKGLQTVFVKRCQRSKSLQASATGMVRWWNSILHWKMQNSHTDCWWNCSQIQHPGRPGEYYWNIFKMIIINL